MEYRKYFIATVLIFFLGILFIFLNFHFESVDFYKPQKEITELESNYETIKSDEQNISVEEYDKKQSYFKDSEFLYNYFSVIQVDEIKNRIKNYVNDEGVLDYTVKDQKNSSDNISFTVAADIRNIEVKIYLKEKNIDKIVITENTTQ